MKIVILGAEARYRAYQPAMPFIQQQELVFLDKDSTEAEILAAGADAEVLFVDAITVVSAALMEHMPCLRLIHSEGVAFDRIDLSAARERGIYVCNNKGCNAGAVAEQTVLLILMLLRHALEGDEAVRAGRQMEMKERCMVVIRIGRGRFRNNHPFIIYFPSGRYNMGQCQIAVIGSTADIG